MNSCIWLTSAMSADHRCLFQAMGMRWRTQIGQVGTMWHEIENDKIIHPLKGDQRGLGYVAPWWLSACNWRATHLLNLSLGTSQCSSAVLLFYNTIQPIQTRSRSVKEKIDNASWKRRISTDLFMWQMQQAFQGSHGSHHTPRIRPQDRGWGWT